jgi:hypothetical protein
MAFIKFTPKTSMTTRAYGNIINYIKNKFKLYTEWVSLTNNRIDMPNEYKELKQKQLEMLPQDTKERLGNTLALHHIIPLSTIRDFLTTAANFGDIGLCAILAWAGAAGLSDEEKCILEFCVKCKAPLDSGYLNPEAFKKLFWPKFNLVFGPSNRADDPVDKVELFSGSKHPKDLREMAKNLERIGSIFEYFINFKKPNLQKCKKLTSSLNKIRDNFTSKNKEIFSFEGNWQFNKISEKWGRISTDKLKRAGSSTKIERKVVEEEGGGSHIRFNRARPSK